MKDPAPSDKKLLAVTTRPGRPTRRRLTGVAYGLGFGAVFFALTPLRGLAMLLAVGAIVVAVVALARRLADRWYSLAGLFSGLVGGVLAEALVLWLGFETVWLRDLLLALLGVVVVAAAVLVAVYRERRRLAARTPEEKQADEALERNRLNLKRTDRALLNAERSHEIALQAAAAARRQAELVGRHPIGGYSTVRAWEHLIVTDRGSFPMSADVQATVDTAGNLSTTSRSTFTRMAAGGLLLGPVGIVAGAAARKSTSVDGRELYLMVQSSRFATLVQCRPDDGAVVRQLAVSINHAARQVDAAARAHEEAVARADAEVERVQRDTAAIDTAKRDRAVAERESHALLDSISARQIELEP